MRLLIGLLLISLVFSINVSPDVGPGATLMQPSGVPSKNAGETVLKTATAPQPQSNKPMAPVRVEGPQKPVACGCCGQQACTCCPKPTTIAPEIKPDPPKCGCQPKCFPGACACPNTCGCCPVKHITPEIKQEPKGCNCCHLDKCGCCVKKTISPELKNKHVAPEVAKKAKCPCVKKPNCACA